MSKVTNLCDHCAGKVKSLTAKKAPELADAVKEAASQPGKAVTKAFKEVRADAEAAFVRS